MSELSPLRRASTDDVELALLRSTDIDEPSARAMARTAAALGLGTSVTAVSLQAAAAAPISAVAAPTASSAIVISALKALAIGIVGGSVFSTAVQAVFSESPAEQQRATDSGRVAELGTVVRPNAPVAADALGQAPPPFPTIAGGQPRNSERISHAPDGDPSSDSASAMRASARTSTLPPAGRGASASSPTPATVAPDLPGSQGSSPPASKSSAAYQTLPDVGAARTSQAEPAQGYGASPAVRSPPNAVSIAEEVRAIERARQALNEGRAREALVELERYQSRWPGGVFSVEAVVLRVQARIQLGERAAAVREANALINAQPNSRHASRLRALLGISPTK